MDEYINCSCPKCGNPKIKFRRFYKPEYKRPYKYEYECKKCGWEKIQEMDERTMNYKDSEVSIIYSV